MSVAYATLCDTANTAGTANQANEALEVQWSGVVARPATFPPEAHGHPIGEVAGLVSELAAKAPTESPTFTGTVTIPGIGTNLIKSGTGDGATQTNHNVVLKLWYGIALSTYDNTVHAWFDARAGAWAAEGGFWKGANEAVYSNDARLTWAGITGRPATFPPEAHAHRWFAGTDGPLILLDQANQTMTLNRAHQYGDTVTQGDLPLPAVTVSDDGAVVLLLVKGSSKPVRLTGSGFRYKGGIRTALWLLPGNTVTLVVISGAWVVMHADLDTDWSVTVPVEPMTTGTVKGTVAEDLWRWRRVGNEIEVVMRYRQTTAGTAGTGGLALKWLPAALAGHAHDAGLIGVLTDSNNILPGDPTRAGTSISPTQYTTRVNPVSDPKLTFDGLGVWFGSSNFRIYCRCSIPMADW